MHRRLGVMISTTLFFVIALLPLQVSGADMVTSNILTRLFALRLGNELASGFTIEVKERQYLITARHFMDSAPSATSIEIFHNSTWVSLPFRRIEVEPATVDIAVLAITQQLSTPLPVNVEFKGTSLSEQVFFLGFPFGLTIEGESLNGGFPLPFVKHGIISAFEAAGRRGQPFFIDGINNPGFSGGPIVRVPSNGSPAIIGVISGYRFDQEPVFQKSAATEMFVKANTGLVIAYPIDYAIEAIAKGPSGL